MKEDLRERIAVALTAIPVSFVLSFVMRAIAERFHIDTPGWLVVDWLLPGYRPRWISGPAFSYLLLVDLGFCWVIVLCLYWFIYKRFYDVSGPE